VIDPEKTHINVFKELNKAKLQSPLILIDPINPSRNAAAALSEEKFNGLVKRSKKFLEEPNETFFEIQKFSFKKIFNKLTKEELLFVISIKPLEGKKDVIATKVLKIFEFLKTHLSLEDFEVTKSEWFFDEEESKLLIFVKNEQLSEYFEREGPPVKNIDSANHFREVHGDKAFERNGRLYVMIKRKFTNPLSYMQHLLKQEYVSEKINNYRLELFVK
jgi:tRNA nucleotidyltransferase (CCA-adding enzyme)